ncbi:MAG: BrnA antitoxin family protein [Candidatus Accumulibacter sp.]|jgi:uncharacterized protein (DUF4415 family)|nr:BrnA antitoxin family protein [Accumulibacter sp.]
MVETVTTSSGRVLILPTLEEDARITAAAEADPDGRPLTAAEWERALKNRVRVRPLKEPVSIRFDPEVLAAFKATGKGWQTRINGALADWLKTHRTA